jgi:hypothetical protein
MRPLLEKIPIAVCTEPLAGLIGATADAARRATSRGSSKPPAARRPRASKAT